MLTYKLDTNREAIYEYSDIHKIQNTDMAQESSNLKVKLCKHGD